MYYDMASSIFNVWPLALRSFVDTCSWLELDVSKILAYDYTFAQKFPVTKRKSSCSWTFLASLSTVLCSSAFVLHQYYNLIFNVLLSLQKSILYILFIFSYFLLYQFAFVSLFQVSIAWWILEDIVVDHQSKMKGFLGKGKGKAVKFEF